MSFSPERVLCSLISISFFLDFLASLFSLAQRTAGSCGTSEDVQKSAKQEVKISHSLIPRSRSHLPPSSKQSPPPPPSTASWIDPACFLSPSQFECEIVSLFKELLSQLSKVRHLLILFPIFLCYRAPGGAGISSGVGGRGWVKREKRSP